MKAQEIMTRDVITVRTDTSVRDIAALMVEKHISGVPVLTGDGKLIGMVSQSDLLHPDVERAPVSLALLAIKGFATTVAARLHVLSRSLPAKTTLAPMSGHY